MTVGVILKEFNDVPEVWNCIVDESATICVHNRGRVVKLWIRTIFPVFTQIIFVEEAIFIRDNPCTMIVVFLPNTTTNECFGSDTFDKLLNGSLLYKTQDLTQGISPLKIYRSWMT